MNIFFIGIAVLMLSGIISNFFKDKFKLPILTLFAGIASIFCIFPCVEVFKNLNQIRQTFEFNKVFGPVAFGIDPLSAFFIVVISIMTFLSVIYSNGYLKPYIEEGKSIKSHIIFLPVLIASMLLVVTCQNALMFLVCWEIMSLSSFFLVIFENEKKEVRQAGIKYLVFMHISVIFIILAFALLSINSASFDFESFKVLLNSNKHLANSVFILAFIGFGIKAGFVPFHNWLPAAHPKAPSHVSAIMSGVMIKTGIYGILRMIFLLGTPSDKIAFFVLIISVISALYGVLYAISQHDIKTLLAYHSIENIGIIGIGIGCGMAGLAYNNEVLALLGFSGAILHTLNHSIFKELLFLSTGGVYLKTHTKNIELLGGLIKKMPKTALLFLTGSVAICGLPPLNGFVSEFLIYWSMFFGLQLTGFLAVIVMILSIGALAFVGTMAILCFTKAFSIIFLGLPRSENASKVEGEVSSSMIFPMSVLGFFCFAIGLLPQFMFYFAKEISLATFAFNEIFINDSFMQTAEILNIMWLISLTGLAFILIAAAFCLIKHFAFKNKTASALTWGCGYNRGNNFMQYTASSYASPFLSMLKPLFKKNFDIKKPKELFPKSAHFSLHIEDIEEAYIINPLIKTDEKFLSKFESLQSGNIQSYIKFGLIFLATVLTVSLLMG